MKCVVLQLVNEWLTAGGSRKSKRNCRLGKAKTPDNVPDVDFGFDRKWDSRSANWHEGQAAMATSSTLNNRRQLPRTPVVSTPFSTKRQPILYLLNLANNYSVDQGLTNLWATANVVSSTRGFNPSQIVDA